MCGEEMDLRRPEETSRDATESRPEDEEPGRSVDIIGVKTSTVQRVSNSSAIVNKASVCVEVERTR